MVSHRVKKVNCGYTAVAGDRKKLGASLLSAAGGIILTAAMARDEFAAIGGALSSFDATLPVLGDTNWAVSLDKHLTVLLSDNITSEKTGNLSHRTGCGSAVIGIHTTDAMIGEAIMNRMTAILQGPNWQLPAG